MRANHWITLLAISCWLTAPGWTTGCAHPSNEYYGSGDDDTGDDDTGDDDTGDDDTEDDDTGDDDTGDDDTGDDDTGDDDTGDDDTGDDDTTPAPCLTGADDIALGSESGSCGDPFVLDVHPIDEPVRIILGSGEGHDVNVTGDSPDCLADLAVTDRDVVFEVSWPNAADRLEICVTSDQGTPRITVLDRRVCAGVAEADCEEDGDGDGQVDLTTPVDEPVFVIVSETDAQPVGNLYAEFRAFAAP